MLDTDRPWLRKDTIYSLVNNGLLISNASTSFEISGTHAYTVFQKVAPLLDGQLTVGEIRNALPDKVWNLILGIIAPLADHGFLRWIPSSDVDTLSEKTRIEFADQISFLAQYTNEPHQAFRAFHEASITLVGKDDQIIDSLARNLCENGAQSVTITEHVNQSIVTDLIILGPTGINSLNTLSEFKIPILVICPAAHYLWALPVKWQPNDYTWRAGNNSLHTGSLSLEWDRSFNQAQRGEIVWDYATSSVAVQRLFGALLAYEVFKGITKAITPETGQHVFALNCLTGETSIHAVTPFFEDVSLALQCNFGQKQDIGRPWQAAQATNDLTFTLDDSQASEYDAIWAPLVDGITTPVHSFIDEEFSQIPIKVSAVTTSVGTINAASAWTTADARIEAIAQAYSLALTMQMNTNNVSVVIGVGRNDRSAVRRALTILLESFPSIPGKPSELNVQGKLGLFIKDVANESLILEKLPSIQGFHVARANMSGTTTIGLGATIAEAQARASLELFGKLQTKATQNPRITPISILSGEFPAQRIRIIDLPENWHIALLWI